MKTPPFILAGHDYQGDAREIGFDTIPKAKDMVALMMDNSDGLAWLDWAIWGNDPETEEWRALEASE